jgi:glucan phosphorylase
VVDVRVALQTLLNGFQHEQPDYWLTFGNPWEIERLIVSYPIKFYGHVSTHTEEGRQVRGGADLLQQPQCRLRRALQGVGQPSAYAVSVLAPCHL